MAVMGNVRDLKLTKEISYLCRGFNPVGVVNNTGFFQKIMKEILSLYEGGILFVT